MRYLALLSLLLPLSGCLSAVDRLALHEPSADNFQSALAAEYLGYSQSEEEQGRPVIAEYYARKGLRALAGQPVEPEHVNAILAKKDQVPLMEARAALKSFLHEDMKRVAPQKLARAQLFFDCWHQQVIGEVKEEMALCVDEFNSAMEALQEVEDAFEYSHEFLFTIAFPRNVTELNDAHRAKIKEIAAMVNGLRHYRIEIKTYLGRRAAQRRLTKTRLVAVHQALVDAGVRAANMRMAKYGSADAVVLSEDKLAPDTKKIYIVVKTHNPAQQATGENG